MQQREHFFLLTKRAARLLQYAKKFLGNPYVWGGTSLTNGCDCSGFAQQIFANFGYTLPRTSRQQAKAGTRIPVQEAKPGDLLFYQRESGFIYHVMIYLGDGKVIHAGSEATGILISDFNYEKSTEFAVRVISEEMRESKIETGDVDNGTKRRKALWITRQQKTGMVENRRREQKMCRIQSAENSTAGDRLESASGKYLGNFKLTAYCNCAVCCGRWAGGPTASGKMPVQGRTIATGVLPFGTKLNIGGKIYTVEDRGTPYGHIDIYMERHADAAGVRRALRGCISVRRNLIKFADHGGMCIRAVADIRSPCNREIRSGHLTDKLRHIRRQLVAFHLREGSEENTIDLFKGMHHFQLGQKRNHLRNAAAHGFEEQDFSAEIRLKIRSGELQKTTDISADHHTFHMIALQKCARAGRRGWETARKKRFGTE